MPDNLLFRLSGLAQEAIGLSISSPARTRIVVELPDQMAQAAARRCAGKTI